MGLTGELGRLGGLELLAGGLVGLTGGVRGAVGCGGLAGGSGGAGGAGWGCRLLLTLFLTLSRQSGTRLCPVPGHRGPDPPATPLGR